MRCFITPIDCIRFASAASKAIGEWRKRSPLANLTTVIRVVNGHGNLIPSSDMYSNGPSTIPMLCANGLYWFSGSYREVAASIIAIVYKICGAVRNHVAEMLYRTRRHLVNPHRTHNKRLSPPPRL